eukprot:jgi/Tetstr1/461775/TSEL_006863.t1
MCVVEEGGRPGEHMPVAPLKELAEHGIAGGSLKQTPSWRELIRPAALVAHWTRSWTANIFLADYLCRHAGSRPFDVGGMLSRPVVTYRPLRRAVPRRGAK